MESPPSSSTWSEAFILSDDSGLLLTSGSVSSGSMSGDSSGYPAIQPLELNDSYCEDDSLDGMSDIMCGENFNTLKKGLNWNELPLKCSPPIDPPPEFQDKPIIDGIRGFAERLVAKVITTAVREYIDIEMNRIRIESVQICMTRPAYCLNTKKCWTSDFLSFSPCHSGRPNSRCSLSSSRLSSSHNSLSVPTACRADDSSFITQAVSHDTLSCNQISDLYNVPFDSDVYAVPVDVVKPPLQPKRNYAKRKRRSTASCCREYNTRLLPYKKAVTKSERYSGLEISGKRHSVAGTASSNSEPIHMTLQEVRQYLQTLYSSSSDSSEHKENNTPTLKNVAVSNEKHTVEAKIVLTPKNQSSVSCLREKPKKNPFLINIKNKKIKDSCDTIGRQQVVQNGKGHEHKRCGRLFSLKQTLCNVFRVKRFMSPQHLRSEKNGSVKLESSRKTSLPEPDDHNTLTNRALPPLPGRVLVTDPQEETKGTDFATSIHKVKDYGWYWGPLSGEAAEKILSNEPDGSFIVRDSSDDHYIFSLTFKLNNCVRHVRIEHDQGNFSFGSCTKFKSQTIVEFIENAVEHSRSGRYLFFLHRRPVIGPVRVQLLHPVSRFKQIQSLQHMCRFVILKVVRRDLIPSLPLPRRIIDYLNTPHYYSEHLVDAEEPNELSRPPSVPDRTGEPQIAEADDDVFVTEDHSGPVGNYVVVPNGFRSNNNPVVLNVRQS